MKDVSARGAIFTIGSGSKLGPLFDCVIAVAVTVVLALPIVTYLALGIDLIAISEESVGYRYFYSLRLLNGDVGNPWLPQGQLVGLFHQFIQVLLSVSGYAAQSLERQIEAFTIVATLLPLLLTGLTLPFVTSAIPSRSGKLVYAAAILLAAYQVRAGGGYHLLLPDYYAWVMPLASIGLGVVLRITDQVSTPGLRAAALLGLYAGICISIKPTYVFLPILIGPLLLLACRRPLDLIELALVSVGIAGATALLISLAYYQGDYALASAHFSLAQFGDIRADASSSASDWVEIALFGALDLATIGLFFPLILGVSIVFIPGRLNSALLLPSALILIFIAYTRFYPPTIIEFSVFSVVLAFAWWRIVVRPIRIVAADTGLYRWCLPGQKGRNFEKILAAVLLVFVVIRVVDFFAIYTKDFTVASQAAKALRVIRESGEKVLIVIPNNDLRPLALETAIYKGGMDLSDYAWPSSPLVAKAAPNIHFIASRDARVDPLSFNHVVYVSIGSDDKEKKNIEVNFGVLMSAFSCDDHLSMARASTNFFLPAIKNRIKFRSLYYPTEPESQRYLTICNRKPIEELDISDRLSSSAILYRGQIISNIGNKLIRYLGRGLDDYLSSDMVDHLTGKNSSDLDIRWSENRWWIEAPTSVFHRHDLDPDGSKKTYWTSGELAPYQIKFIQESYRRGRLVVRSGDIAKGLRIYGSNFPDPGPVSVLMEVRVPKESRSPTIALSLTGEGGQQVTNEIIVPNDGQWHSVSLSGVVSQYTSKDNYSIGYDISREGDIFELRSLVVLNMALPDSLVRPK